MSSKRGNVSHDWSWISFYLKEENAWDIILELTKVDF